MKYILILLALAGVAPLLPIAAKAALASGRANMLTACNELALQPFTNAIIAPEPVSGRIVAINASQLAGAHFDMGLSAYVAGQPAPDLEEVLNRLCPVVPTMQGRYFEFQQHKDEKLVTEIDDSDIRAAGASFKRIEYGGTSQTGSTINKGLTLRMDYDRIPRDAQGNERPGWRESIVSDLRKRLVRAELYRLFALLDANDTATASTWSSSSNPDGDLRTALEAGRKQLGIPLNTVAIAESAWQIRQDAYEASTRANHAMSTHANYTPAQLASYLGVDNVERFNGLYQSKKGGTKADIQGQVVFMYYAQEGQSPDDPSHVKRFVSDCQGGGRWGVYLVEATKYVDITVEHYSTLVAPITSGIRKNTVAAS